MPGNCSIAVEINTMVHNRDLREVELSWAMFNVPPNTL